MTEDERLTKMETPDVRKGLRTAGAAALLAVTALHALLAAYSYFVPLWAAAGATAIVAGFVYFRRGRSLRRASYELLFVLSVINIPFGAGGYLYAPWTAAAAVAVVAAPPVISALAGRAWWPAFRWSLIAVVTAGFLLSVPLRGDAGFDRCGEDRRSAGRQRETLRRLPSHSNPYGVYIAPGGCPVVSCYSMQREIGVTDCAGHTRYYDVPGNPQQIAADPGRNMLYFPLRGTNLVVAATMRPFGITGHIEVPGARGLIGADVQLSTGDIALVGEMKHDLFVVSGETHRLKKRVPLGPGVAYSVAVDQRRGYALVSDWAGLYLHRVDLSGGRVKKLAMPFASFNVRIDSAAGLAYVARPLRGRIAVIDIEKMQAAGHIDAGYGVRDIALDTRRGMLVCGNYFDGTVDVIDAKSGRRTHRYMAGPLVRGVAADIESGRIALSYTCGVYEIMQ